MLRSKTNSYTFFVPQVGKFKFQPTRYDENNNLLCALYRKSSNKWKCKLTGRYNFEKEEFEIIWQYEGFLENPKHKKLLTYTLKQYDWK